MQSTHTLIIGASAAGLASAACLQKEGVDFILLEKSSQVAAKWRQHYDRLHLHTSKNWSALPYMPFKDSIPRYPSKQDLVDYLEDYTKTLKTPPVFNTQVFSVKKDNGFWLSQTNTCIYRSRFVIIATGMNHTPVSPVIHGMNTFNGEALHSSAYKNGREFAGRRVLVVGFGNSACELAICLHENGAHPGLSVRSPVNVLPRDILGFPVLEIGRLTSFLPARIADKLNAPLIRMIVGDITRLGLKKSRYGPREQINIQKQIPLLDIGTIKLIKQGYIKVYSEIEKVEGNTVHFKDAGKADFEAIIFATGYKDSLDSLLQLDAGRLEDLHLEARHQTMFGRDGVYFCGFYLSPMGMLREIGIEARRIAKDIAGKKR